MKPCLSGNRTSRRDWGKRYKSAGCFTTVYTKSFW
jgi:hypothetical protein